MDDIEEQPSIDLHYGDETITCLRDNTVVTVHGKEEDRVLDNIAVTTATKLGMMATTRFWREELPEFDDALEFSAHHNMTILSRFEGTEATREQYMQPAEDWIGSLAVYQASK